MSSPSILSPCIGLTRVFGRAKKFDLTLSHLAVLIAIKSVKVADYDSISAASALSTHTLRGAASPLKHLSDEGFISSEMEIIKQRSKRIYTLTEQGENVLFVMISGQPVREEVAND